MGKKQKEKENAPVPNWGSDGDLIVDLLLHVANGDPPRNAAPDAAIRLKLEFAPLVQMAAEDRGELHRREYSARLQEVSQRGAVPQLASEITRRYGPQPKWIRNHTDLHAACSEGVLLLIDPRWPYGGFLCKCRHCERFYRAQGKPNGGPVNRVYCSESCRIKGHDAGRGRRKAEAAKAAAKAEATKTKSPRKHK